MEAHLQKMGFENIISAKFGERVKIANDVFITTYEPASLWNDAQILLELGDFHILNINDAGINHKIHEKIKSVDLICSAFSPGASGYPATWTHLNDTQKIEIYEKSRTATLEMLKKACEMYDAKYFLPFASHFILNHPAHLKYMKLLRKNTIFDVTSAFKDSKVEVLPLLFGDAWSAESGLQKMQRAQNLYDFSVVESHIKNDFDKAEFETQYPKAQNYDKAVVLKYFENLNNIPEMVFCEDLVMSVYPIGESCEAFSFEIKNGVLKICENLATSPNITMKIPSIILMQICKNNESWDEATIGYWCEFSRNPDIYHTEFWRIMQCPYYLKNPHNADSANITAQSNVAWVLERLGEIGEKIFGRYGLYCLSCNKAYSETIAQACAMHGIDNAKCKRLLGELRAHLG
ncbi:hypothetical protein ACWIUD_06535 [Helicobacter sp. 23-1044]